MLLATQVRGAREIGGEAGVRVVTRSNQGLGIGSSNKTGSRLVADLRGVKCSHVSWALTHPASTRFDQGVVVVALETPRSEKRIGR